MTAFVQEKDRPASEVCSSPIGAPKGVRLASIDAYRGLVMLLMMAEVLSFHSVSRALPESGIWGFLAWNQTHVEWVGMSLHDLIQPSFSFLVGVALPFSIAGRLARGQSRPLMTFSAVRRALLLVLLGIFLRSLGERSTNWTFEDTLTQIGCGYGFLFLLGFCSARNQWIVFGAILAGYWAAFALWPLPGPGFDYSGVGISPNWLNLHGLSGFGAHWQKNSNLAAAFDRWFLNLFPRDRPFLDNSGGYATLSFIPTLATMILGLLAGNVLRDSRTPREKIRWLAGVGATALAAGAILNWLGVCPLVKRIWTPSWTLFSGGWCFLLLAAFYGIVDGRRCGRWAFPLVVVGMNSIGAYLIAHLCTDFIAKNLVVHLGRNVFRSFGAPYEKLLLGSMTLLAMWLMLHWMYRRRLFLKI